MAAGVCHVAGMRNKSDGDSIVHHRSSAVCSTHNRQVHVLSRTQLLSNHGRISGRRFALLARNVLVCNGVDVSQQLLIIRTAQTCDCVPSGAGVETPAGCETPALTTNVVALCDVNKRALILAPHLIQEWIQEAKRLSSFAFECLCQ